MGCHAIENSRKYVAEMGCRANGIYRATGSSRCADGMSHNCNIAQLRCRASENSRQWNVAQMGCRVVEKSRKWDVAQLARVADGI